MRKVFFVLMLVLMAGSHASYAAQLQTLDVGCCQINYNPALTSPVPAAVTEKISKLNDRMDIISDRAYPFDIRLSAGEKNPYAFFCDSGPSGDPACHITSPKCQWWEDQWRGDKTDPQTNPYCQNITGLPGTDFVIPGDGCVYTSGHTNTMFNEHRKFCLTNGNLVEVRQDVLTVGLTTTALQDITLYNDQMLTRAVTLVKAGEPVEVIAAQNEPQSLDGNASQIYLLSDKYGITGWASLQYGNQRATQIKGLFYNGD